MNKILITFLLFTLSLTARQALYPTQECPAFNNMKHTQNTHNVILDTAKKYMVLKHHKGQNLILVKDEQPAQRWVDDECFLKQNNGSESTNVKQVKHHQVRKEDELQKAYENTKNRHLNSKSKIRTTSKQNILVLSWHNAFCETHRYKKECKRGLNFFKKENYAQRHFVLHGLWPQPRNNMYCGVNPKITAMDKHKQWNRLPDLNLSEDVQRRLEEIMPGFSSNLHKHEWIKHGSCYGTDANRYYRDAIHLVHQVNDSKIGDFFIKHIGKQVTLNQVRSLFEKTFGRGTGRRVELRCNKGFVTELWLHLGSGSDDIATLLKRGKKRRSRCQKGFMDKAGF